MLKTTSPSDGSTLNVLGHFKESFQIGNRWIGGEAPVLIIAEAGVSHFGSLEKAIRLVDLAADAGADLFKTQAFATDRLISSRSPEWRDRLRSKEADFDFLAAMKARCDERDLPFICTGHDESVLPWLDELNVPAFKIGSGERGNVEFIRTIAERGKPVILSTGMYRREDVQEALEAVQAAGCDELAVLHCVTSYPTPPEQVNLRVPCHEWRRTPPRPSRKKSSPPCRPHPSAPPVVWRLIQARYPARKDATKANISPSARAPR
jgi:N-acetylneuraminate synthase/N,N'-diacetyllegionaminate synthase